MLVNTQKEQQMQQEDNPIWNRIVFLFFLHFIDQNIILEQYWLSIILDLKLKSLYKFTTPYQESANRGCFDNQPFT